MCWSGECLYQSERASTTYMCLCPNECTCTSILCVVMCCSPQERSHCGQRVQLRQLEKKFVRCSIRVLISHLKAMLHKKLSVPLDLKVNTFLCSHLPSQGHAVQKKMSIPLDLKVHSFLCSHLPPQGHAAQKLSVPLDLKVNTVLGSHLPPSPTSKWSVLCVLVSHLKAILHRKLSVPLDLKVHIFLCSHLPPQGHASQKTAPLDL